MHISFTNIQTVLRDPLPAELAAGDEIPLDDRFKTSSATAHDVKHTGGPYGNSDPIYKKAPGHWKVDYVKDFHEKVVLVNHSVHQKKR